VEGVGVQGSKIARCSLQLRPASFTADCGCLSNFRFAVCCSFGSILFCNGKTTPAGVFRRCERNEFTTNVFGTRTNKVAEDRWQSLVWSVLVVAIQPLHCKGLAGVMNWFVAIIQFLLVRFLGRPCPVTARKLPLTPGDARGLYLSRESPLSGWLTLLAVQSLRARPPTGRRPDVRARARLTSGRSWPALTHGAIPSPDDRVSRTTRWPIAGWSSECPHQAD
jgi:hypothetical protein